MVGMKPAGGISNAKLALHYLVMVREVLGPKWLTNDWFRFGASSLTNDLLMQMDRAFKPICLVMEFSLGVKFFDSSRLPNFT